MKLLVGLGNIGTPYENTRHNFGFLYIDALFKKFNFDSFQNEKKFFGQIARGQIKNEKVILLKPETYMNLSGKAIVAVLGYYKLHPSDVWVFFDDVDLEFGQIRFREKGSSGGHNGIKSIISALGSEEFPRIKLGIKNQENPHISTSDFVLGKFTSEEKAIIPDILKEAMEKFLDHFA